MFTIQTGDEPVWYDDKLYIRDGHEKQPHEISGNQVNAVYKLFSTDAKQFKNGEGRLRIRIGDYRLIYRVDNNTLVILVIKIAHCSKIYKNL